MQALTNVSFVEFVGRTYQRNNVYYTIFVVSLGSYPDEQPREELRRQYWLEDKRFGKADAHSWSGDLAMIEEFCYWSEVAQASFLHEGKGIRVSLRERANFS